MIQVTDQTIKRLQKNYEKNDFPSESLRNACYADRQKLSVFFFKMNGVKINFSATLIQIVCKSHFFSISIVF